jgi:hypothetical protein
MGKVVNTYVNDDRWYLDEDTKEKVPGVSAIVDMMPKPALTSWAARMAALFVVDNIDTVAALAKSDRDAAIDLIKRSPWRKSGKAAGDGTDVHEFAEIVARAIMKGVKPEGWLPKGMKRYLRNYVRFLKEFDVEPVMLETVVWNKTVGYAGRIDLMGRLRAISNDLVIVDTKSGQSGIWDSAALQQTGYVHAEYYVDDETGEFIDMPKVAGAYGLWLRPNGWALQPLETGEEEWQQFQRLRLSYEWKRTRSKKVVGRAINNNPLKRERRKPGS